MLVVPFLKTEGQLIKNALSGNDPREKSAAEHLQAIILVRSQVLNSLVSHALLVCNCELKIARLI